MCGVLGLKDRILQLMTARIIEEQSGNCGKCLGGQRWVLNPKPPLMVRIVRNEMEKNMEIAWKLCGCKVGLGCFEKSPMGLFDEKRASG